MIYRIPTERLILLCTCLLMGASSPAFSGAYYLSEIGTRSLARGGANVVNPGDPSAIWLNPAAITNSTGVQLQLNNSLVFLNSSFVRDCGPTGSCGPRTTNLRYGAFGYQTDGQGRAPSNDETHFATHTPNASTLGKYQDPSQFGDRHAVVNQALPQYVPSFFATLNLDSFGLDGFAIGAGFFAPHAGDYQFPANETTRYTLIDRDLYEVFYSLTLGYRFQKWLSIGGSLQGVTSGLKQQIKISADPYGNENPDQDILIELEGFQHFIPSGNFGLWTELLPGLEFGSSVQLGRRVEATGPLRLLEFGPGVEELMASDGTNPALVEIEEDNPQATVRFTMPPFYRTGLKYGMERLFGGWFGFDVELDFVYEQWSVFDHISVASKGVGFRFSGGEPEALPPIVQPKNYNDCWSVRLGGQVDFLERLLQLRSGIFYETAAIPNETYTVELQNGEKIGVGLGMSLQYWGVRFDFGYAHLFLKDRVVGDESIIHVENTAPPTLSPGERRTRVAMGQYSASYDMLTFAVNIAFDEMFGFGVVDKAPWEKGLIPVISDQ